MNVDLSAASPPRSYRPPRSLSRLVTAVFLLYLGSLVAGAVLLWDALGVAQALAGGREVADETLQALQARGPEIQTISLALFAACAAMFCIWTYRVAHNALALGGRLSVSPGFAVGYYFLPGFCLWCPFMALSEIWEASEPRPGAAPRPSSSLPLLLAWWSAWLISLWLDVTILRGDASAGPEAWVHAIHMALLATAVEVPAIALAIAVIWKLTGRQERRARAELPRARVV